MYHALSYFHFHSATGSGSVIKKRPALKIYRPPYSIRNFFQVQTFLTQNFSGKKNLEEMGGKIFR